MQKQLVLTILADDQPGVVEQIASILGLNHEVIGSRDEAPAGSLKIRVVAEGKLLEDRRVGCHRELACRLDLGIQAPGWRWGRGGRLCATGEP